MTNTLNKVIHNGDEYELPEGFSPDNAGTTDDVLTKTANGYEWSAPSGGDVLVSDQANNILTSGMKIWCGTEGDYANLGTYDSNSLYLTVPGGATPSWPAWAVDLIGYRPLTSDADDHKGDLGTTGTTYNGTWSGTATYGTVSGRTGASFSNNSYIDTGVTIGARPLSYAVSLLKTDNGAYWRTAFGQNKNSNPNYGILGQETNMYVHGGDFTDSTIVSNYSTNTRYNIVVTTDGSGTIKYYLNGTLMGTKSGGQDVTGHNWCIAKGIGNYCNGAYIADCAIWSRVLTDSEIADFNTYINS